MRTDSNSDTRPGIRWWPAFLIVIIAAIVVATIQIQEDTNQQQANVRSVATSLVAASLIALWLLLFSRLRVRTRLACAVFAVAAALLFLASFRVRGVTGNLLPVFEWRWSETAIESPPSTERGPSTTPLPGLADYAQFFGPSRNGTLAEPRLARDWDAEPPVELWRRTVGEGWSGFAVSGRRAVTQEQHGDQEAVVCYDVATGEVLWMHRYDARYESTVAGVGPRATPTIVGERLFALGATGILHCLDLRTGAVAWYVNIIGDNGAALPDWGISGSPLVVGDRVVVSAGGAEERSLVAYSAKDGTFVWGGGSDGAHYASPLLTTLASVEQIVIFNAHAVASHAVPDGRQLWAYPWKGNHPHVAQPIPLPNDELLISSGYGTGCHLVHITRDEDSVWKASRVWKSLSLKAKFANAIAVDGFVYGLDDGIFACVDLETGRRRWKRGRYGHGQLILARDVLLVMTESGDVVLVEPVPDEMRELSRFAALDDKTWNPPTLAGAYLLVRNDLEAACYRLPLAGN